MTVKELREALANYPDDMHVTTRHYNGEMPVTHITSVNSELLICTESEDGIKCEFTSDE